MKETRAASPAGSGNRLELYLSPSPQGEQYRLTAAKMHWTDTSASGPSGKPRSWKLTDEPGAREALAVLFVAYRLWGESHPDGAGFLLSQRPVDHLDYIAKFRNLLSNVNKSNTWPLAVFGSDAAGNCRLTELVCRHDQGESFEVKSSLLRPADVEIYVDGRLVDGRPIDGQQHGEASLGLELCDILRRLGAGSYAGSYEESYARKIAKNFSPRQELPSAGSGLATSTSSVLHDYCQAWREIFADPLAHDAKKIAELRLDRYVWRRLSLEQQSWRREDEIQSNRAPIPGTGREETLHMIDELLRKRRVVLYDDAGMGKTAFTHKCFELLLDASCTLRWFGDQLPLVVRFEGRWPRDMSLAQPRHTAPDSIPPPQSVRAMLIDQVLMRLRWQRERQVEKREVPKELPDEASVAREVDAALAARRVIVFVDAFDQMTESDREHVASLLAEPDLDAAPLDPSAARCVWFLTGRAYAIRPFKEKFSGDILLLRLERFDEQEQDGYFEDVAKLPFFQTRQVKPLDWICQPRRNVADDLGLPLNLREIRTLLEDCLRDASSMSDRDESAWDSRRIAKSGDLHEMVAEVLLKRGLRHVEQRRAAVSASAHPGQPATDHLRLGLLMQVCGLIALQMMLERKLNASVDSNDAQGSAPLGLDGVQAFLNRARARFLASVTPAVKEVGPPAAGRIIPEEAWNWAVDVLQEIEVTHRGDIDSFNKECRSFRDRKTMEWYAAYYLMHHATEADLYDVVPGAGEHCVRDFAFDDEWLSNCWWQAIDMPAKRVHDEAAIRSLGVLFARPRDEETGRTRPCQHLWRAWERWLEPADSAERKLRGADQLIARFRSEFTSMCEEDMDAERQLLARSLRFDATRDAPDTSLPEPNKTPLGWYRRVPPEGPSTSFQGERPERVTVSAFWLRKFVVTNAEYRLFDPHHRSRSGDEFNVRDRPVVDVDWYMASMFCRWLGDGYRLPTEARWEAACRANPAGATPRETAYWFGDDEADLARHAWIGNYKRSGNAETGTCSLEESLQPGGHENPWGLVDMHGNVWEWCQDYFDGVGKNPARVARGGSWYVGAGGCRSAFRLRNGADFRLRDRGFRVCLDPFPVSTPPRQEKTGQLRAEPDRLVRG